SDTCFHYLIPRHPNSTLFPYTTLFRSGWKPSPAGSSGCLFAPGRAPSPGRRCRRRRSIPVGCPSARLSEMLERVLGPQRHPRRRSEEHTSELQSRSDLVCRLLLEKKKV